jgi:uncharacterized protein (UPF0332 family)
MPYRWEEFLSLARTLQKEAGTSLPREAAYRSAVSRAYYAAFNYACVYAENHLSFSRTREAEDHRRLRELFIGRGNPTTAALLDDLRKWRNTCDYDDTKPIRLITELVSPAISKADELIKALST